MEKLRKEAVFFIMSLAVLFCSSCNSGFREEKRIEAEISTFVASRQNGSIPTIPATTIILTATETAIPAIPTVPRVTPWIATHVPEQPVVHFTDAIEKSAVVQNAPLQQSTSQEIDQKYTPIIVDANPSASDWRNWPVVPQLSKTAADIFWFGVNHMGTRANYFSKVGDCQSYSNVFLGNYDQIAGYYELSDDELYLEDAIHFFSKAFGAESLAVNNGMSVASVLTSTWADPSFCNPYESMIQCELRVNKPSIIFVNLGTNWNVDWETSIYYDYLDELVYTIIENGTLPILSSKADDVEGGHEINEITAQISKKYGIPFFNFWSEAQKLENGGLDPQRENIYLSMEAWKIRSYWALKTLHYVGISLGLF